MDEHEEKYKEGRVARREGKPESSNPYRISGHERDTTYGDLCNYQWESGGRDENILQKPPQNPTLP